MAATNANAGILAAANEAKRSEIIELLTRAYWMEMETVMSYVANAGYGAFTYNLATASVSENTLVWQGQTLGHSPDAYLVDWDSDGQLSTPDKPDVEDQAIQRATGNGSSSGACSGSGRGAPAAMLTQRTRRWLHR